MNGSVYLDWTAILIVCALVALLSWAYRKLPFRGFSAVLKVGLALVIALIIFDIAWTVAVGLRFMR